MNYKSAILILAAGSANRMKKPKQLLPYKNNTLLGNSVKTANAAKVGKVYCVLGAHYKEIHEEVSKHKNVNVVFNPLFNKGIGASISAGINAIKTENPSIETVVISLGDLPLLPARHFQNLLAKFNPIKPKIIASKYRNSLGVPALFPKQFFNDLIKLNNDFGAKQIINNAEQIDFIEIEKKALLDIDTPNDYEELLKK